MKFYLFFLLGLTFYSCKHSYVVRNYEYAPAPNCDCYVYGGGISVGALNVYKYKRKAKCNKLTYFELRDSLSIQETIKDSLLDKFEDNDGDSTQQQITQEQINFNQMIIDSINNEWIKCKIKLRYKEVYLYRQLASITTKRKIKFYGLNGRIGKTTYLNDSIVKTDVPNN